MPHVEVRSPGLSLRLIKNVGRSLLSGSASVSTRFSGQQKVIDLAPYLGDRGGVRVSKSVREPAGGFTITFCDRINQEAQDTVYGLVEPMDLIEIRMSGTSAADGAKVPIMMRGFVSEVRRSEAMNAGGQPDRSVILTGQDYGKVWQMLQVFFMPNLPDAANMLSSFPFFARFGLSMKPQPANTFVQEVFDKIINKYITDIGGQSGNNVSSTELLQIQTDIQIQDGIVSPFGIGAWRGGTIHSLLMEHCDVGPWNELFIEDREAGPFVVYRPNPFKTADGTAYVQTVEAGKEPTTTVITRADVISHVSSRSDANVANYYWVDAPRFALNYGETLRAMTYQGDPESFFVQSYGNVDPKLYGIRKMWEATQQGGLGETSGGNGTQDGPDRDVSEQSLLGWINARRKALFDQNKDNILFESGVLRLKGNENIRAGSYVRINNGSMTPDYYAPSVQHDYIPFGGFFTTVNFERGTGFIDRAMQGSGKQAPYWAEQAAGINE